MRIESGGQFSGLKVDIVDATNWHLDEVVAAAAKSALSPQYRIVGTSVSGYIVDTDTKLDKALNATRAIETQVSNQVRSDGPVDYLLVIGYGNAAQPYRPGVADMVAIGVKKQYTVWDRPPLLHTYLQVSLLDAKSDKVIATSPLAIPPQSNGFAYVGTEDEPIEKLEGFEWHETWAEMSEDQRRLIEDHIKQMIERAVPYTLKAMKIVP